MNRRNNRSVGVCSSAAVGGNTGEGGGSSACSGGNGNGGTTNCSCTNGGGGGIGGGIGGGAANTGTAASTRSNNIRDNAGAAREASEPKAPGAETQPNDSYQSLAHALTHMQESMQSMNQRIKKTDQAVRGVGQRLNLHGRIMQKIQKRMTALEHTLHLSAEREGGGSGISCAPFPAEGTRPAGPQDSAFPASARFHGAAHQFRSRTGGSPAASPSLFPMRPRCSAMRPRSCGRATPAAARTMNSSRARVASVPSGPRSASFARVGSRLFSPSPSRLSGISRSLSCMGGSPGSAMYPRMARMRTSSAQPAASSVGSIISDVRFSSPLPNRNIFPRSVSSTGSIYTRSSSSNTTRSSLVPRSVSFTGPAYVPGRSPSIAHARMPIPFRSSSSSSSPSNAQQASNSVTQASRLISLGKNLLNAAQEGRTAAVRNLLDAGANPNFTYGSEWTPLHRAAAKSHADVVAMLLKRGADVNARTSGFTALHMAAYYDLSGRCVSMLIDAGSDLNSGNHFWRTPLHYASEAGNDVAVRALVAAGAKKNPKDNEGKTPLDVAKTHCVRRFLAAYPSRPG